MAGGGWAGAGRSDTEGSECSGVHWSASSDPVYGTTRHPAPAPAPDSSSARTRNHSAEWMELDTVLSNAETGSISFGYGHGVWRDRSGLWILDIDY